jgi:hypothetical protein
MKSEFSNIVYKMKLLKKFIRCNKTSKIKSYELSKDGHLSYKRIVCDLPYLEANHVYGNTFYLYKLTGKIFSLVLSSENGYGEDYSYENIDKENIVFEINFIHPVAHMNKNFVFPYAPYHLNEHPYSVHVWLDAQKNLECNIQLYILKALYVQKIDEEYQQKIYSIYT